MKKFFLSIGALGVAAVASWAALGAPGAQTLTSLSGTYLLGVDAGAVSAQTSLTTLAQWMGANLGGTTGVTCSGTTTATCNGTGFTVSITGLTTTPGSTSTAMVVGNTSVTSASKHVLCNVNGYSGTGVPVATLIVPGTNQVSVSVTNVAGSGNLNATVPIACQVF